MDKQNNISFKSMKLKYNTACKLLKAENEIFNN